MQAILTKFAVRLSALRRRYGLILAGALLALLATLSVRLLEWEQGLPDFRAYPAGSERKAAFIDYARPLVEAENARLRLERKWLTTLSGNPEPGWYDRWLLREMAKAYGLGEQQASDEALIEALLLRLDVVPASLALAQAAKESGWGTSRFARKGNNLYGQRCFVRGCGLVPRQRTDGNFHEVRSFPTPFRSIQSYIRNINSHQQYQAFREQRAQLRKAGLAPSGLLLADALGSYSERGEVYVEEIKQLIHYNGLEAVGGGTGAAH
jgi:Bax protein